MKRNESYSTYIRKVLKQVHPDLGMSKRGMATMNSFVLDAFEKISSEAGTLVRYSKKATLTTREIQTAVRLTLSGQLAKHAVSEGVKASVPGYIGPALRLFFFTGLIEQGHSANTDPERAEIAIRMGRCLYNDGGYPDWITEDTADSLASALARMGQAAGSDEERLIVERAVQTIARA